MTVTLRDIANECGFSVTTVSQVLRGCRLNHASLETQKKIRSVAKRMNYRPNLNARQLVTRNDIIIGVLIDTGAPHFYMDVVIELEHLAFTHQYYLQVGMIHDSFLAIRQYVDYFMGIGIRKVLCMAHNYPEFGGQIPQMMECFDNVVFLEQPLVPTRFPVVSTAHYDNHFRAVQAMLQHGYRRICCIRRDYQDKAFEDSYAGVKDAYRIENIPWSAKYWKIFQTTGKNSDNAFQRCLKEVLKSDPQVLILNSDKEMLMALRWLQTWGRRVPEDICLFSSENSPFARNMIPSLAGFEYQPSSLAKSIFKHLKSTTDNRTHPVQNSTDFIPATTFWGESCPLN